MNQTERLLNAAADHIAATLEQPSDMRAWEQLLIYCPRTGAEQMIDAIAALANRFWRIHPREIQDLGITREQFYEREMKNLFAIQAARIEQLEARLDRAVTRGLEQVERIATLEAALREIIQTLESLNDTKRASFYRGSIVNELTVSLDIARAALAPEQDK